MSQKYSVHETGPQIEQFLRQVLDAAGFELTFTIQPGDQSRPEFENPDLMVKFQGADVDLLRCATFGHGRGLRVVSPILATTGLRLLHCTQTRGLPIQLSDFNQ